ncbi:Transcriptional adapter 2-alpha [Nymphon striatum]|nr:Transcriptional adapter 2-alpha [Nymphon striatum]
MYIDNENQSIITISKCCRTIKMEFDKYDDCAKCKSELEETFIQCEKCLNFVLCLSCFSKGEEIGSHSNDHPYKIIDYNFPVLDANWTAAENMRLLNGIYRFGLGNWSNISQKVSTKSMEECKQHYTKNFINSNCDLFPKLQEVPVEFSIQPSPIPYIAGEDPPRPSLNGTSVEDPTGAGYMPARGDFAHEYDNYAEWEVCEMEILPDEDELNKELKYTLLDIHQSRLRERERRHRVIRNHGLISMIKQFSVWHRYEDTIGKMNMQKLAPFSQFFLSATEYEIYVESVHAAKKLISEIQKLTDYRKNGIAKLHNCGLYNTLKKSRVRRKPNQKYLDNVLLHVKPDNTLAFLEKSSHVREITSTRGFAPRRQSMPLDIVGLPFYEKLDDKEKELCSVARIAPKAYFEFRALLEKEYKKYGSLKLAQARSLISIDVNKTRKLYDFLISEEIISK